MLLSDQTVQIMQNPALCFCPFTCKITSRVIIPFQSGWLSLKQANIKASRAANAVHFPSLLAPGLKSQVATVLADILKQGGSFCYVKRQRQTRLWTGPAFSLPNIFTCPSPHCLRTRSAPACPRPLSFQLQQPAWVFLHGLSFLPTTLQSETQPCFPSTSRDSSRVPHRCTTGHLCVPRSPGSSFSPSPWKSLAGQGAALAAPSTHGETGDLPPCSAGTCPPSVRSFFCRLTVTT